MKSSLSIWRYVVNVKSTVKISSVCVAFLENMNFNFLPILQCTQNSKSDIISTYILIETHFDISPHLIIIGVNVILNIDNYSHWIIALIYL